MTVSMDWIFKMVWLIQITSYCSRLLDDKIKDCCKTLSRFEAIIHKIDGRTDVFRKKEVHMKNIEIWIWLFNLMWMLWMDLKMKIRKTSSMNLQHFFNLLFLFYYIVDEDKIICIPFSLTNEFIFYAILYTRKGI